MTHTPPPPPQTASPVKNIIQPESNIALLNHTYKNDIQTYIQTYMKTLSLPDNFLFSKPPQFQPPVKYWGHFKNFNSDTTNCGVDGIVVLMVKIHYRHHNLWC